MRYGVALPESAKPDHDGTLRALDAFAERSRMPDLFPVWCRDWRVDAALIAGIRSRGVEPVCYVTTADLDTHEDTLRLFACRVGDGTVVRLNHEMDGRWGAPWHDWTPEQYVEWYQRSRGILRSEADVRTWWCPSTPRKAHAAGYWPGEAEIVGFDRYAWDEDAPYPPEQFAGPARQCRAISLDAPIWVGEHGSLAGIGRRAERLRALENVEGVDAVIVMNLEAGRPDGKTDDWRWTPAMVRTFAVM